MTAYEITLETLKALGIEALKWGLVALLGWLGFKFRPVKITIAKVGIARSTVAIILIAVTASGFLNGVITILYNHYAFEQLVKDWGKAPEDEPKEVNVNGGYGPVTAMCPAGTYVIGVRNYGNRAGRYCIGCFVAVQVLCRKLNT